MNHGKIIGSRHCFDAFDEPYQFLKINQKQESITTSKLTKLTDNHLPKDFIHTFGQDFIKIGKQTSPAKLFKDLDSIEITTSPDFKKKMQQTGSNYIKITEFERAEKETFEFE